MTIYDLRDWKAEEIIPGYRAHFVHSENMSFAYWEIEPGIVLPEHSHHHEQVVNLIEGEFDLTVDGITTKLLPGMVAVIPANASHTGIAAVKSRIIDVFYPVREDYRVL